jgi:hypothetical protein
LAALARSFIEHDGSGRRYVQRTYAARHRNAQKVVAAAADEVVETGALAPKNENAVAGEVELVVVGCAALVESNNPEVPPFELVERANKIDDARDPKVFGCSRACPYSRRAQRRRAALGEDDAIDAGAICDAQQRAEVLRIFDAIESQQKAGCAGLVCSGFKQLFKSKKLLRAYNSDHTLVRGGSGQLGEMFARLLADANTGLATVSDEVGEPIVVALAGDEDMVKAAAAGLECLLHRMEAVENFHEFSLDCR